MLKLHNYLRLKSRMYFMLNNDFFFQINFTFKFKNHFILRLDKYCNAESSNVFVLMLKMSLVYINC